MFPQIVNPISYNGWDDILLSTEGSTFFQSSTWAEVLSESYGFTPYYFYIIDKGKFSVLFPLMEVESLFRGRRAISLPFTDYCEPIIDKSDSFFEIFYEIIKFGKRKGWKCIEFRGGQSLFKSLHPMFNPNKNPGSENYIIHNINLRLGEDVLFKKLRESNRRNIKKAQEFGVKIEFSNNWESLENFCYLNSITRKRHGIPPQPKNFFKIFYEKILQKGNGIIALALYNGKPVSAYIFCLFGKDAIYKYGASDLTYQHLRANNLLMWESIRWLYNMGYERLSLGRTEHDNHGLRQFKNGWGGEESLISYSFYDLKKEKFINKNREISRSSKWIFNKLPIPILNFLGSILYRHAA